MTAERSKGKGEETKTDNYGFSRAWENRTVGVNANADGGQNGSNK